MGCTTPPSHMTPSIPPIPISIPVPVEEIPESEEDGEEETHTNVDKDHNGACNCILDDHPLTLYVLGRLTTLCLNHNALHTAALSLMDVLPPQPAETALKKLHDRHSYIKKAPYQRKSKKRAVYDAVLKFCPASWIGPTIIKQHDKHEYKRDRKYTQEVYSEWQVKRGTTKSGRSTSANSIVGLETHLAPLDWDPPCVGEEDDPWKLPPIEEII